MNALDFVATWLMTPISGITAHEVAPWLSWHGRTMVLAWGVALPLGVLIARFFKVTPQQNWPHELDNKFWWHAHRSLQYAGVGLMSLGVGLAWGQGAGQSLAAQMHGVLGWTLLTLGWLQVVGGLLRGTKGGPVDSKGEPVTLISAMRGDHYDMTPYRKRFEWLHKTIGYCALLFSVATINLGLYLADAPRWMWSGMWLWWIIWLGACMLWQKQGRCVDTYQAIWGPGLEHPGNQKEVV